MKKNLLLTFSCLAFISAQTITAGSDSFENASSAVDNMRVGWNLGNTLDSNSGDTTNMWIEWWTAGTVKNYETAWGQPQATQELIDMFKDAGFGTIRVPVTWYPHIDDDGNIDSDWLERVHEVVDYVIDDGLYCILNVHHDTGAANTHWLIADGDTYSNVKEKYSKLWTNIANEFKDYDEHLLFEAYNEMLDSYNSWCFASYATSTYYNSTVAADAYAAINNYAQTFVDAVRATGGNNAERNLIVSTYGGCSGEGTWSSHLPDPLKQLTIPTDDAEDHIISEVHMYPTLQATAEATMESVTQCFNSIKTNLVSKGVPVVIGEWGTSDSGGDYSDNTEVFAEFAQQFVELAKDYGYATIFWMLLSDASDRSVPQWTAPEIKDAIITGYYGEDGYVTGITTVGTEQDVRSNDAIYDLQGRRVTAPTRGMYIKGGKKFVKQR